MLGQEISGREAEDDLCCIWTSPDPSTCRACHPSRTAGTARCTCKGVTPCNRLLAAVSRTEDFTAFQASEIQSVIPSYITFSCGKLCTHHW